MKKKFRFKQLPLAIRPNEPLQYIVIKEFQDGKPVGYGTVKVPKPFLKYPLNPYLMN